MSIKVNCTLRASRCDDMEMVPVSTGICGGRPKMGAAEGKGASEWFRRPALAVLGFTISVRC